MSASNKKIWDENKGQHSAKARECLKMKTGEIINALPQIKAREKAYAEPRIVPFLIHGNLHIATYLQYEQNRPKVSITIPTSIFLLELLRKYHTTKLRHKRHSL